MSLKIHEIYRSIQGETSFAGLPCVFIRTTGCSLRCTYCDTTHAFYGGKDQSHDEILNQVKTFSINMVLVTGGEPLDQENTKILLKKLCDQSYTVLLETAGHKDISQIDPRVHVILDMKTPSSAMMKKNDYKNLNHINKKDEVKFVIGDKKDLEWSLELVEKHDLTSKSNVLFSPVHGTIPYQDLANAVADSGLPIRMQLQLHKIIWAPNQTGV